MQHRIHVHREVLRVIRMIRVESILVSVHQVQHQKAQTQIKQAPVRIAVRDRFDIHRPQHQTTIATGNHT